MSNKPIAKFRSGKVELSVWENEKDGRINRSFSVKKSYKDKDGNYKDSNSYFDNEAKDLMAIAMQAICYFGLKNVVNEKPAKQDPAEASEPGHDESGGDLPF